jgi:hypothetical protein
LVRDETVTGITIGKDRRPAHCGISVKDYARSSDLRGFTARRLTAEMPFCSPADRPIVFPGRLSNGKPTVGVDGGNLPRANRDGSISLLGVEALGRFQNVD